MRRTGFRAFEGSETRLSDDLRGKWLFVETNELRGSTRLLVVIDMLHDNGRPPEPIYLREVAGRFRGVLFAGHSACAVRLRAFGNLNHCLTCEISRLRRIGSLEAAVRLLSRFGALRRLVSRPPIGGMGAWKTRLREAQAATIAESPTSYADWLATFAAWSNDDIPIEIGAPTIIALIFAPEDNSALKATFESIGSIQAVTIRPGQDWRETARALAGDSATYFGLLGAGEILTPHAVALAKSLLLSLGLPEIAIADEDRIDERGDRIDPLFKPTPNHTLLLSGTLSRGLWLVRADVVGLPVALTERAAHAELARLDLWLSRRRTGAGPGRNLPHILVSRRPDAVTAPVDLLSNLINEHLALSNIPLRASPSWPVRLHPVAASTAVRITAIVPSTLRGSHTEACLKMILSGSYAVPFDVIVAVSQPDPLDADQRAMIWRLGEGRSKPRVLHFIDDRFNFARTVNRAAREASGTALLLLNDDVAPLGPDWLARMSAHLADHRVGIVGARLLYPNDTLQHAGIIMGLAGFCEHAFRHEIADAPGYAWRAQLPQRLSAVTGACLLIEKGLWQSLGGMDEAYPSAYNDVDLCLRADEAGWEVVLSDATMLHHELQTYGAHFSGERAPFEAVETARMRARWRERIEADPFYSPNLDLRPGREWTPSFPPRLP